MHVWGAVKRDNIPESSGLQPQFQVEVLCLVALRQEKTYRMECTHDQAVRFLSLCSC